MQVAIIKLCPSFVKPFKAFSLPIEPFDCLVPGAWREVDAAIRNDHLEQWRQRLSLSLLFFVGHPAHPRSMSQTDTLAARLRRTKVWSSANTCLNSGPTVALVVRPQSGV